MEVEAFDPTIHEHDARLKPDIAIEIEPVDYYGARYYWVSFINSTTNRVVARQLFDDNEYQALFDVIPENGKE